MSQSQVLWYLTRGSGLVALVLLTASVVLGVMQVKRWATDTWPRFIVAALHKNVSLLSVVFLAIHITTTVVDGFAPIGWLDVVLPFRSGYRPLWLGLGAVAVDLLLAVIVTSMLRGRIGLRVWRAVHWAAYACWPVALLHGLGTGTDTKLSPVLALNLVCLAAVVIAVWWRLADAWSAPVPLPGAALPAAIASVAVPVAVVAFLLAGPLQPGWARRAGTPSAVASRTLASGASGAATAAGAPGAAASPGAASAAPASGQAATSAAAFSGSFTDAVAGTIVRSPDGTSITIDGDLTGSAPGHLHVVLQGQPNSGGGIVMSASAASIGPAGQPTLYQGSVSGLAGSRMVLAVHQPGRATIGISVQLNVGSTTVTGTVTGGAPMGGEGSDG